MASQPHMVSRSADATVSEQDWTSPLLADHGDAPSSYVEPNRLPVAYPKKPTSLSMETKALARSSVRLPGAHMEHTLIDFNIGTAGLGLPASILNDSHFFGEPSSPTHPWRRVTNGESSFSLVIWGRKHWLPARWQQCRLIVSSNYPSHILSHDLTRP